MNDNCSALSPLFFKFSFFIHPFIYFHFLPQKVPVGPKDLAPFVALVTICTTTFLALFVAYKIWNN